MPNIYSKITWVTNLGYKFGPIPIMYYIYIAYLWVAYILILHEYSEYILRCFIISTSIPLSSNNGWIYVGTILLFWRYFGGPWPFLFWESPSCNATEQRYEWFQERLFVPEILITLLWWIKAIVLLWCCAWMCLRTMQLHYTLYNYNNIFVSLCVLMY